MNLLKLFFSQSRIPLPNCGPNADSLKDQTQAGDRRQEADFSLWEENCVQARQSSVSVPKVSRLYCGGGDAMALCLKSDSCFSWYKDGELLEYSHPNYITLKDDQITIVANAINEGTYTCIVKKRDKVLTNYSWRVRVRF